MVDNGDACGKGKDMVFVNHQQSTGTMVDSGAEWSKGKDMLHGLRTWEPVE